VGSFIKVIDISQSKIIEKRQANKFEGTVPSIRKE
jgi:hypothetical protein